MSDGVNEVKEALIETAARTTQDLGLGRIVGQVMAYTYLSDGESSLDDIGSRLGLSKAAVSIAARQLESLGLLQRVWKKGDRKNYYRTAPDFGLAVQNGIMTVVQNKIDAIGLELDRSEKLLGKPVEDNAEQMFILQRVQRAQRLRKRFLKVINNPILKLFRR